MYKRLFVAAALAAASPSYAQSYTGYFNVVVTSGSYERFNDDTLQYDTFSLVGQAMVLKWSTLTRQNVPSPSDPSRQLPSLTTNRASVSNLTYGVVSNANNDPFLDQGFGNTIASYSGDNRAGRFGVGFNSNDAYDSFINFTFTNGDTSAVGSGTASDRDDAFETFRSNFAFDIVGGGAFAAVPEPASWALMLTGFGAVGGALRRRGAVRARYRTV